MSVPNTYSHGFNKTQGMEDNVSLLEGKKKVWPLFYLARVFQFLNNTVFCKSSIAEYLFPFLERYMTRKMNMLLSLLCPCWGERDCSISAFELPFWQITDLANKNNIFKGTVKACAQPVWEVFIEHLSAVNTQGKQGERITPVTPNCHTKHLSKAGADTWHSSLLNSRKSHSSQKWKNLQF